MEKVLLFGRVNVGKSTLYNKLVGGNKAIVEEEPGVTRDLNISNVEWVGNHFTLIDSGGMDFLEEDFFSKSIVDINTAVLKDVSLVLFVVDYQMGLTPHDKELANFLRKHDKKVIVVVNKNDNMSELSEFYALGFDNIISVSAMHSRNTGDLLDYIVKNLDKTDAQEEELSRKVIIVGKPNVGKSTLFNQVLGKKRVMVTPVAGTTRDYIEETVELESGRFTFIDTAGLRRKRSIYEKVEKHSVYRTVNALDDADLCLFLISAEEEISLQETKIAGLIKDAGTSAIIILNKWDSINNKESKLKELTQKIKEKLYFIDYAPLISISAKTGLRVNKIEALMTEVFDIYYREIPDKILNNNILPILKIKVPEIKFIKQVKSGPPVFKVFSSKKLHFSKKRFVENTLREHIDFTGTPIRLSFSEPD